MSQKIYYINVPRSPRNTAGRKAPEDISEICRKNNLSCFPMPMAISNKSQFIRKIWLTCMVTPRWSKLGRTVRNGDVIIYQHPMYGKRVTMRYIRKIQKEKNCKFIALIHDLESLRRGIEGVIAENQKEYEVADNVLLKLFDVVICHNEHMRQYLIAQGFNEDSLVNLEIFDYLCSYKGERIKKSVVPSVAIAGNLAIGKCKYIYDILDQNRNKDLILHLYGNNFDEAYVQERIIYHGSFLPEDLPNHLEGDFGLVWDGISAKTCAGNTGEYLKYNNPHKASLYLASGMPVIVWSQAAIADFILEHKVGVIIDSLYNLEEVISSVSEEDYKTMCENAAKIGEKIRSGFYFKSALYKCLDILGFKL